MSDITIKEFCDNHGACQGGLTWALANCPSGMMSEAYDKLSQATDPNVAEYFDWTWQRSFDDKTLRLLAVRFARDVQHLAPGSDKIIDVVERYANGKATDSELASARDSARASAWESARASAWESARESAWASARASSWASAGASARESVMKKYRSWVLELGNPFKGAKHE